MEQIRLQKKFAVAVARISTVFQDVATPVRNIERDENYQNLKKRDTNML